MAEIVPRLAKAATTIREKAGPRVEKVRKVAQRTGEKLRTAGKDPRGAIMRVFRHEGARASKPDTADMFSEGTGGDLLRNVASGGEVHGEPFASPELRADVPALRTVPVTTEQAHVQQVLDAQGPEGDSGNGRSEADAQAIVAHAKELQQQAETVANLSPAEAKAALDKKLQEAAIPADAIAQRDALIRSRPDEWGGGNLYPSWGPRQSTVELDGQVLEYHALQQPPPSAGEAAYQQWQQRVGQQQEVIREVASRKFLTPDQQEAVRQYQTVEVNGIPRPDLDRTSRHLFEEMQTYTDPQSGLTVQVPTGKERIPTQQEINAFRSEFPLKAAYYREQLTALEAQIPSPQQAEAPSASVASIVPGVAENRQPVGEAVAPRTLDSMLQPHIDMAVAKKQAETALVDLQQKRDALATDWEAQVRADTNFAGKPDADIQAEAAKRQKEAVKAMAAAEAAYVQLALQSPDGQADLRKMIEGGDEGIIQAASGVDENFVKGVLGEKTASKDPDKQDATVSVPEASQPQNNGPEKIGTKRRLKAEAALAQHKKDMQQLEADIQAFTDAKQEAAAQTARTRLEVLQQQLDAKEFQALGDNEAVARAQKSMQSDTYTDRYGRVHKPLKERFAGEKGWRQRKRNGDKYTARKEVERMSQVLSRIEQDELDDKQRKIIENAHQDGSVYAGEYEKDMGYILRRIRQKKYPALRRYFFKPKLTPEQEREVALDQLRALSGQMDDSELKKYNRPTLVKLIFIIFSILVAAGVSTSKDTMTEAVAMDTRNH